jgi:hypothetical protein
MVVRLPALCTRRTLLPRNIITIMFLVLISVNSLSPLQKPVHSYRLGKQSVFFLTTQFLPHSKLTVSVTKACSLIPLRQTVGVLSDYSVPTSQQTHCVSVTKACSLIPLRQTVGVLSEHRAKHMNILVFYGKVH